MKFSVEEQLTALLIENPYVWAVNVGIIQYGETLHWGKVFSVTKADARAYLKTHPVPGVDLRIGEYQGVSDGPKWKQLEGRYVFGWQERGIFMPEGEASSMVEFREKWSEFLVSALPVPA